MTANQIDKEGLPTVKRLGGNIGAEIGNIDLCAPLDDAQFGVLHDALIEHEVVVMRDQDITLEQQKALGQRFGNLSIHPFSPNLDDQREVIVLDYSAENPPALTDQWHADETFRAAPPALTMLRANVVAEYGGDTLFASMTSAYTGLSERMKRYIHGLTAQHDFKPWRPLFTSSEAHQAKLRELEREWPNPAHPLVSLHPVSGRRVLNVNAQFTVKINGLKADESDMILAYLYSRAQIPEFQLRVKWAPNTVVIWDNRSVHHYAPHDYYPQRRSMSRITVEGELVRGVEGDYTPEENVPPLPDGHNVKPAATGKRPTREFERGLQQPQPAKATA